jgi:S-methylmethionine-dependent homocysteine/selenocysteine methylase
MIILDGGMGRQLERIGAPFRQPEWSALTLMESPPHVIQAHTDFINAGAQVITTNSYALVPFHIGEEAFAARGAELLDLAGKLACEARDAAAKDVKIAAGVPPLFGSYRPDNFDQAHAPQLLSTFREHLLVHCDLVLAETLSSVAEAEAFAGAFADCGKPVWMSLTLIDEGAEPGQPKLRSGEPLDAAFALVQDRHSEIEAVLFNCSQPEVMADGVAQAKQQLSTETLIGVYANAFPPKPAKHIANTGLSPIREDLTPERYKQFADEWAAAGATIIGGCCGVGPEHIAALAGVA